MSMVTFRQDIKPRTDGFKTGAGRKSVFRRQATGGQRGVGGVALAAQEMKRFGGSKTNIIALSRYDRGT
jgi:hypothetical protein